MLHDPEHWIYNTEALNGVSYDIHAKIIQDCRMLKFRFQQLHSKPYRKPIYSLVRAPVVQISCSVSVHSHRSAVVHVRTEVLRDRSTVKLPIRTNHGPCNSETRHSVASSRSGNAQTATDSKPTQEGWTAVYPLIFLLISSYLLNQSQGVTTALATSLKFNIASPLPWQYLTSAVLHHSTEHLAQNVFLVYIFGKVTETMHGGVALWLTYLGSAAGACLASQLFLPKCKALLCCSSAGVLGLFVVGLLLPRLQKKPMEILCLTPFTVMSTLSSFSSVPASLLVVSGVKIGHAVPVLGAIVAAVCIALVLHKVRDVQDSWDEKAERERSAAQLLKAERERSNALKEQSASTVQTVQQLVDVAASAALSLARKIK